MTFLHLEKLTWLDLVRQYGVNNKFDFVRSSFFL